MTRIAVIPADTSACGWYRMRLPAGAVRQVRPGWQVDVYRPGDVKIGTGADGRLWGVQGLDLDGVDCAVLQRVSTRSQVEFVRWLQSKGIAVVVDSDDAMWCIHPDNSARGSWNTDRHHWKFLDAASEAADLVTVTTDFLAQRYGGHGRVEVLPNCVPAEAADLESARDALDPTTTVGWAGFTSTHPDDLPEVGNAVRDLQDQTACVVRVVGDAAGAARIWQADVEPVSPTPLGVPYLTALTTLDIGLVPLQDSRFNRGKSYLKALEFAAMGVAVVASPTPANVRLSKILPMELADRPDRWYDALLRLVNDPDTRAQRADTARKIVYERLTYEANAERWAQAWERAMNRRARMSA